jgi:hypothetical protein
MKTKYKPKGYWTKEHCHAEAKGYDTRKEFRAANSSAYSIAHKKGWLDDICGHMVRLQKPHRYWAKERCHEEALKYQFRVDFKKGCAPAYQAAQKHGWIDDICGHMTAINLPAFTKGLCKS